jgi:pyruvate dehydrogenase (quinone)/pyruvate oxidase
MNVGMIKWEQMVFLGNPEYGVDLHPIDFVQFAEACGGVGFRCETPDQVRPALQSALNSGRPSVVEAVVDPFEPPMPARVSTTRDRGARSVRTEFAAHAATVRGN